MGADIGLAKAIAIFTFATLAGGLTGAPGGVGGAEAAMVALLALDGVRLDIAVPATALIRLTTLWFALAHRTYRLPLRRTDRRHDLENRRYARLGPRPARRSPKSPARNAPPRWPTCPPRAPPSACGGPMATRR